MNLLKTNLEALASKRVSFIIFTKNRSAYLEKALALSRKLIHPDDELIIVDGLSTDYTAEVVNNYADLVNIFISEPDISANHAFNKGILLSRGKYIKHLSDDDEFYPEGMEQAIKVLEAHPEVDILYCGGIRQRGEIISNVYVPPGVNYGKSVKDVFLYGASGVGFVYRRSALSRIGLIHPTDLDADQEIILRAISRGANVKFCRINLFYHPIMSHSVTTSHRRGWERDRNRLIRQYCSLRFYCWYRWCRPLRWYYVNRWWKRRWLPWLLNLPGVHRTARAFRDIVLIALRRKRIDTGVQQTPEEKLYIWDGGFS